MSYSEKWDDPSLGSTKKQKTILSIPRRNFFVMIGVWAGIGALLGYSLSEFVRAMNMVC